MCQGIYNEERGSLASFFCLTSEEARQQASPSIRAKYTSPGINFLGHLRGESNAQKGFLDWKNFRQLSPG